MGMSSDQNENVSFKEEIENKRKEAEKLAAQKKLPVYTTMGTINLDGKKYQLLVGEDRKWYKSEFKEQIRFDEMNRTPLIDVFSRDITPVTKEEFDSYFHSKKV